MTPPLLATDLNCPHVEQSVKFGYENLRLLPLVSLGYIVYNVVIVQLFLVVGHRLGSG